MTTMPHEISERLPLPLVPVACEFCGSTEATTLTGPLMDIELADELPPAFRSLSFVLSGARPAVSFICANVRTRRISASIIPDTYKCFQSYDERGFIMKKLARSVARGKLRQIAGLMPPGNDTLLDYGCGSGTWLTLLKELGCTYRMIGTDITGGPLQELRQRGIEAYPCDETTLRRYVKPGSVGVVHLFHVIEHLPNARRFWNRFGEVLAPGGVLIGQTPNVESLGRRFWGDLWYQWHAPQHLVLFSDDTLRAPGGKGRFRSREHFKFDLRRHAMGAFLSSQVGALPWPSVPAHPRADVSAADPGGHSYRDS